MNIPNQLTIFRLILVMPFIVLFGIIFSLPNQDINFYVFNLKTILFLLSGFIFALAMMTDWLDGYLARKYNWVSIFGKLFDPISDKFITSTAFIGLAMLGFTPYFIPIIFILRDILVDGSRNLAAKHNYEVQANIWGKLKTVLQTLGLLILFFVFPLINASPIQQLDFTTSNWNWWLINLPVFVALITSLFSGVIYLAKIKSLIKLK